MYAHDKKTHNWRVRERVNEIKSLGLNIIYEKWFESDDEDFCYWAEIYLIDYFGRESLCNIHPGGDGAPCGESHPCKDPKVREKLRLISLNMSDETRKKLSEAAKARKRTRTLKPIKVRMNRKGIRQSSSHTAKRKAIWLRKRLVRDCGIIFNDSL